MRRSTSRASKGVTDKLEKLRVAHKHLKRRQADRKKAKAKAAAKTTVAGVSRGRVNPPVPSPGHYIGFSK